ncbi:MAG TPA: GGDEF domain-containing protein [Gemmatimonadales bacterium]|nr:GGDEF domain-containing protein [Gemmatimonadales bacterium]
MLVFAVVATLVPTLVVTVLSSRQNRRSIGDQIAQELRATSTQAAWEIDQWLSDRLRDLRVAATAYAVPENLARIQGSGGGEALSRLREYLNSVRDRCPDCDALLVVDGRGRFVTSSGGRMSGVQFTQDRLNALRTSDALVGDAYWDTGLSKAAIGLAVPIRQADGKYVGSLMAKINLRAVADLLQRLAPRDPNGEGGGGGGGGADIYVMTEQGRLILRSRVSSAELMRTRLPTDVVQPLTDREGSSVEYKRADGRDVIGTLRRLPALRWATVVEMPRAEAVRQAGGGGTSVLLIALLLAAALAAYVGSLIVRPLQRLSGVVAKAASGDTSVELPTGAGGEVGQLTQVFKNLVTRVREREGQGELERLSVTDALTGLYNRRHLMGTLANEVQRSRRLRRTFSVLLADVDHFKQYNDTQGHLGGDAALVKIAEILRQTTRGVDSVARYGGEEFVVMLIEAPIATAAAVGERLRARVAGEDFGAGRLTVSVGAAEYPTHGETPEELIASADAAMYQAKNEGRDRVIIAGRRAEREKEGKRRRKGEG